MTDALARGDGVSRIAALTGLSRQTVYRIKEEPAEAAGALARWEHGDVREGTLAN